MRGLAGEDRQGCEDMRDGKSRAGSIKPGEWRGRKGRGTVVSEED